jgi:hypothetical protein
MQQKADSKRQLVLAEESKKAALRDTEERLRQDMETYISEVAHLQAKVRLGLGWSNHDPA